MRGNCRSGLGTQVELRIRQAAERGKRALKLKTCSPSPYCGNNGVEPALYIYLITYGTGTTTLIHQLSLSLQTERKKLLISHPHCNTQRLYVHDASRLLLQSQILQSVCERRPAAALFNGQLGWFCSVAIVSKTSLLLDGNRSYLLVAYLASLISYPVRLYHLGLPHLLVRSLSRNWRRIREEPQMTLLV